MFLGACMHMTPGAQLLFIGGVVGRARIYTCDPAAPLASVPGDSSGLFAGLVGEGNVVVTGLELSASAPPLPVEDPLHPERETLQQYGQADYLRVPSIWLRTEAWVVAVGLQPTLAAAQPSAAGGQAAGKRGWRMYSRVLQRRKQRRQRARYQALFPTRTPTAEELQQGNGGDAPRPTWVVTGAGCCHQCGPTGDPTRQQQQQLLAA